VTAEDRAVRQHEFHNCFLLNYAKRLEVNTHVLRSAGSGAMRAQAQLRSNSSFRSLAFSVLSGEAPLRRQSLKPFATRISDIVGPGTSRSCECLPSELSPFP
jgi:hypothetical protein